MAEPWARTLSGFELVENDGQPDERKWYVAIEKFRIRKRYSLGFIHPDRPGLHETIAYFKDKEAAERFAEFFELIRTHGVLKETHRDALRKAFRRP